MCEYDTTECRKLEGRFGMQLGVLSGHVLSEEIGADMRESDTGQTRCLEWLGIHMSQSDKHGIMFTFDSVCTGSRA